MVNTKFLHYFAWRLVWLAAMLSLSISWNALALEWCPNPHDYGDILVATGTKIGPYPTDQAALQAALDAYHLVSDGGTRKADVISCNGQGVCTVCHSWPRHHCNFDTVYWNGKDDYLHIQSTSPSRILLCSCSMLPSSACDSSLSISLAGGTEIEPSSDSTVKNLPIIVTVVDQNTGQPPTTPVAVKVSLKVDPKSGGHDHGDSTRPRGGIAEIENCTSDATCWSHLTDGSGQVVFNFNAPEASGKHTITATCDGCSNTASKAVDVKVEGLKPIPPSGLYALYEEDGSVIGAVKGRHESNHYLTPTAANKLLVIATNYHHQYPNDPILHVNDGSLMWGGVLDFDVEAEWKAPHEEHRRGTVVDIRANSKTGTIPSGNFESFKRLAKLLKAHAKVHSGGQTNQHFHVRLLNRSE